MPITPVQSVGGRHDDTITHISSSIRAPVFVDNAVLHAKYTTETNRDTGTTTMIAPPKRSDFQYVHDKSYRLIETQDGVRLLHPHKSGMRYDGAIVFNGKKLDTTTDVPPMLIFGTDDTGKRLVPHSVDTDTTGSALPLANMQSRRLSDFEFDEKVVRIGQTVSVGYRTTDGVQQLLKGALHSLNSFDVGFAFTGPRVGKNTLTKGADIKKHSRRFVAHDFYGVGIIQAMKFFGRYDGHTLYFDRFGNLMYAPHIFSITNRKLGDAQGVGEIKNKPLLGVVNQIVSEGMTRGLNDDNRTIMDDLEMQKQIGSVKTTTIYNPLSRTPTSSRRGGAEALRANKKAQRVIQSKSHINSWDLDPGDIVKYEAPSTGIMKTVAVLDATHSLRSQDSDFTFMSNEAGIESIIAMAESKSELQGGSSEDTSFLNAPIEMSNTGTTNLYITPRISTFHISSTQPRNYSNMQPPVDPPTPPFKPDDNAGVNRHAGMIIGHRDTNSTGAWVFSPLVAGNQSSRGTIGVGHSYRATAVGAIAGGVLTVDATAVTCPASGWPNERFPDAGTLLIEDLSGQSVVVTYTGRGASPFVTFTGCTPANHPTAAGATVIYARPRGHEMRMSRGQREVVM